MQSKKQDHQAGMRKEMGAEMGELCVKWMERLGKRFVNG